MDDPCEQQALENQDRIATMTDQQLVAAYQESGGKPGNPWADMLAAALHERNVDL